MQQIQTETNPRVTFRNVHELAHENGRVVMMEISAAPIDLPIAWKGHYYARAGESLTSLGIDKQDEIRSQTLSTDWSAQIVEDASLSDLDVAACKHARDAFATKYANRWTRAEIAEWPLESLLDRAKVTQAGEITRTALLLLGKPEAGHRLSPHPAQLTWKLIGPERAYEHFGPPFLLATTRLFQRIRNVNLKFQPENELLSYEVAKYDRTVVLEALHNCIAHQDYGRNGRIVVTEYPAELTFENEGKFFEGSPDDYVHGKRTPRLYRNSFLTQAMTELNMIDTVGYGIHRMFIEQRRRYFPLPDYVLSDTDVCLKIHGGVVDPAYTLTLMKYSKLALQDVLALDRVQKKLPIPDDVVKGLRRAKLIEGRKPHYHVSAIVADAGLKKAQYIKMLPFDNSHYEDLIINYLKKFGRASRKEIHELLEDKLSDVLDDAQKVNKVTNLITRLRTSGRIANMGSRAKSDWQLTDKNGKPVKKLKKGKLRLKKAKKGIKKGLKKESAP